MGLWDNIKNIMTIPDEDDFEDDGVQTDRRAAREAEEESSARRERAETPKIVKSKTVNYNRAAAATAGSAMQVVLVKPDRFDDVTSIADNLNDGKTVVLNLEDAAHDVSRRIVDFLSGVAYANAGNMRKVAKNTFIIAARGVDVMGELTLEDMDDSKLYY